MDEQDKGVGRAFVPTASDPQAVPPVPASIPDAVPRRVKLSRARGWRMPPNTVSVARPGRYGNPFRIGDMFVPNAREAVGMFRMWLERRVVGPAQPDLTPLRGKNLACWCPLDAPCHADVLLELANAQGMSASSQDGNRLEAKPASPALQGAPPTSTGPLADSDGDDGA